MVTLAEALNDAERSNRKVGDVDRLLATLDATNAALLDDALRGSLSSKRLADALTAAGYPMGRNAVDGWRNRNMVTRAS
jgi:hypothetical protein